MRERTQSNRKGRVFAGGGLLVVFDLLSSWAREGVRPDGAAAAEAPAAAPPRREAAAGRRPRRRHRPRLRTAGASRRSRPPPPVPAPTEIPFGTVPKGPVPPASPPAMPNIDFGGRIRSAVRFQGVSDPKAFNDVAATLYADLYASGQINRMWRWLLAITSGEYGGTAGAPSTVPMSVLDAIVGFTPMPEFQIYAGRLLVMADRYAPSGPWSMDEWFYPGFFVGTPPAVPKAGPAGPRHGRRGLGRAARRSHQVLPGRLSIAGSGAVAAAQRSRAGEPALAASRGGFIARRTTATETSSPSASAARSRTTVRSWRCRRRWRA